MAQPGTLMWAFLVLFFEMHMDQVLATTCPNCPIHYLASVPGILESGSKSRFCVSLSQPSSRVLLTVTLKGRDSQKTLLIKKTSSGFHECFLFLVPSVDADEEQLFQVSVKGSDFYSREIKRVLIKAFQPRTFIQTDKPIYNHGQTVQFRVVTLDTNLQPVDGFYDTIVIKDPYNNRIAEWVNQAAEGSILQLSYLLADGALEGFYRIVVQAGEQRLFHSFKVQKYGLSKFDIVVTIPKEVSVGQSTFKVRVCAKNHYGKPVDGDVTLRVCRPLRNPNSCSTGLIHKDDISLTSLCKTKQKQTCNKGCVRFNFKVSDFLGPDSKQLLDVLDVSATVVDKLTCASHTQWERIRITYLIGRLFFEYVPTTYTQGTNLVGKVRASDYLGQPVPNLPVYLFAGKKGSPCFVYTVTTDESGYATFSIDTSKFIGEVYLYASSTDNLEHPEHNTPYYDIATFKVHESGPGPSTCGFLKILPTTGLLRCRAVEDITIQYSLEQQNECPLEIVYLILSRGRIVYQGVYLPSPATQGQFSFSFKVRPGFAPSIQIVAYTVLDCERVLAYSAKFYTEDCFKNKISPKFYPSPAIPGEDVKLCIEAKPNSVCGVSLIDLNVLARADARNLDADQIYDLLPIKKSFPLPQELVDEPKCVEYRGLQLLTNLAIKNPTCLKLGGKKYHEAALSRKNAHHNQEKKALEGPHIPDAGRLRYSCHNEEMEPVHKLSTETWLFHLVKVGEDGKTCVSYTVPEILTTWNTEVFCVSPRAFGLANPILLSVFRPFSLDFKLPYSMIRGESLELKSVIYNYLGTSLKIKVTAAAFSGYTLAPLSTDKCTFCLCAGEHKIIRWTFIPTSLGDVTVSLNAQAVSSSTACCNQGVSVPERGKSVVVTRSLQVKAIGHEIIKTHSWLLCPKGHYLSDTFETHIPTNVIGGSLKAKVSVSGNILSRGLENLGDLLHLPYGCGEQNIAFMAIDTYILHYLKTTNQLCHEAEKKGLHFLITGYQRQLTYRDKTGAFSTFGSGEGNTWLTAFVMATFYKAMSLVYIDPKIIEEARKWLECQQLNNGCFKVSGNVYNNKLRGGVSDEVTVSAYVTAALLETNIPADNPVVTSSLSCLRGYILDHSNMYTTALMAYVFSLAGDWEASSKLLHYLDSVAIREGNLQYWCPKATVKASPLCVEISSYVLLARLTGSASEGDLLGSSHIIRWLVKQQSYYGGFKSSQDTAVAIKALTLYYSKFLNREGSTSVSVTSPTDHLTFHVNHYNKLVYQESSLQDLNWKYSLKAEGTSCAAVQVTFFYNLPASAAVCSFSVEAKVEIQKCCHERLVTLKLKSLYKGDRSSTNMVILDIEIPSGFFPVTASLWNLKKQVLVKNVEYKNGRVFVYLQKLPKDSPVFHELELIQEYEVQHLRSSTVAIYDYYCPSVQGVTEYCGKNCHDAADVRPHEHHHQHHMPSPNHRRRPHHGQRPNHGRRRHRFRPFLRFRRVSHISLWRHNHPKHDHDQGPHQGYKHKLYD